MRITIPTIGSTLTLIEPWAFMLHWESRNAAFWDIVVGSMPNFRYGNDGPKSEVVLPPGTALTVDRIYIRKGVGDYDSVTFRIRKKNKKQKIHGRFWAKLGDVNRIECKWEEESVKRETDVSPLSQIGTCLDVEDK